MEFAKAALLDDVGHSTEAIALLQLALERFPDHPGVRYQIALIQDKAGMPRESVRSFESLLKDRPEDASLLNALGYSLADRNQKLPRAETLIRKALVASPDNPAFLDSLGWVLFRRGDIPGSAAVPGARVPHLPRCRNRLALGRAAVGEWQAGRGARLVGAVAGAFAGFQAAARHHRTTDRHEDGAGRAQVRRSAVRRGRRTPIPRIASPPPTSTSS